MSPDDSYLDEVLLDGVTKGSPNPYVFTLLDKDVVVTAVFKPLPADNYKVILRQPAEGGTVSFTIAGAEGKEYGPAGSTVTLSNTPASGYIFKAYMVDGVTGLDAAEQVSFQLPSGNVIVSGIFEKLADKTAGDLITAGKDALIRGDFAVAVNAYEAAYAKAPDNAEALVFSSLGKLASVAWSKETGDLFKNRLGLKYYPNTLDALLDIESWFEYYPAADPESGDAGIMPPLTVPGWLTDKKPYQESLVTIDGKTVASSVTWSLILAANFLEYNAAGLNGILDDVIDKVFNNPNIAEAAQRTAALKGELPVELDAALVRAFGLEKYLGDNEKVYVGWAELELLLSSLNLVKASLLYVDSYKWDYDISFVKNLPWDESVLKQLEAIITDNRNKVLPFRTGFMTGRGGSYIENSRRTYVEALTSSIAVYDYYAENAALLPEALREMLQEYAPYKAEVEGIKNAINGKGKYTLELDDKSIPIDFGKLFTSGQFALDRLIENEGSGNTKSPVFYGWDGTAPEPAKITKAADFENPAFNTIGFKIITGPVDEVFGAGFGRMLLEESEFADLGGFVFFNPAQARMAWAVYHWDEGGKELITGGPGK
jgi:hypothetical protein